MTNNLDRVIHEEIVDLSKDTRIQDLVIVYVHLNEALCIFGTHSTIKPRYVSITALVPFGLKRKHFAIQFEEAF